MCTIENNVSYMFLPHGIPKETFEKETTNSVFNTLQKASKLLRKVVKGVKSEFTGYLNQSTSYIPTELKMFLSVFLGESIDSFSMQANTIAQLLLYNMKSDRSKTSKNHYHSTTREPPIPLYLGWKIYAKTKSAELVTYFNRLGVCPTYKRISELNNQITVSMIVLSMSSKRKTQLLHQDIERIYLQHVDMTMLTMIPNQQKPNIVSMAPQ